MCGGVIVNSVFVVEDEDIKFSVPGKSVFQKGLLFVVENLYD